MELWQWVCLFTMVSINLQSSTSTDFGITIEGTRNELLLSRRSLDKLEGVDDRLVAVVKHAITATKVDFGVIQGLRTLEQQKELYEKGASQTMKSKHLTGDAVDLMAYINGRGSCGSCKCTTR